MSKTDKKHNDVSNIRQCKTFAELKSLLESVHHDRATGENVIGNRTLYFDYLTLQGGKLDDILAHFKLYAKVHGYGAFTTLSYAKNHIKYRQTAAGWKYQLNEKTGFVKLTGLTKSSK